MVADGTVGRLWRRHVFLLISLAAVLFTYAVTFVSSIVSGDNIVQYYQTAQIVDSGRLSFTTSEVTEILRRHDWGLNTRFAVNMDGNSYSQVHGLGQAALTIPSFVVLRALKRIAGATHPTDMSLWCLNWLFFSTTCVALTIAMCVLVGAPRPGWHALITFAAAFGSPVWMFSALPFNVVGETLLTLAAIVLCLLIESRRLSSVIMRSLAGAALAATLVFALFTRVFSVTALPAFIWWLAVAMWRRWPDDRIAQPEIVTAVVGLAAGSLVYGAFNVVHFGSPFATAYYGLQGVMNFDGPWIAGFTGTFLSPLKSPLYFFPLVVLFPAAISLLLWRGDAIAIFVVLFLLPQVYLIPKYSYWDGGPDLFARFWLWIVPIVLLTLVVAVRHLSRSARVQRAAFALILGLTLLGVRAQLLTALTDERMVYAAVAEPLRKDQRGGDEFAVHDGAVRLLLGDTVVEREQIAQWRIARSFLCFAGLSHPADRLPVVIASLIVCAVSLFAFFDSNAISRIHRRN